MNFREKAKKLKQEIGTLFYAYKDKRTPLYVKVLAIIVVGYALSPIDLIPDFIPILGYLDDIILLPLGIYLVIKLLPNNVIDDSRKKAIQQFSKEQHSNYIVATIIVIIWILILVFLFQ